MSSKCLRSKIAAFKNAIEELESLRLSPLENVIFNNQNLKKDKKTEKIQLL